MLLLQMMTGDWHEFMFGSVDAVGSLSTSLYYMSYVALVVRLWNRENSDSLTTSHACMAHTSIGLDGVWPALRCCVLQ